MECENSSCFRNHTSLCYLLVENEYVCNLTILNLNDKWDTIDLCNDAGCADVHYYCYYRNVINKYQCIDDVEPHDE